MIGLFKMALRFANQDEMQFETFFGLGFRRHLNEQANALEIQCLCENLMSNNFRRRAVLKKYMNCKLKLQSDGFY